MFYFFIHSFLRKRERYYIYIYINEYSRSDIRIARCSSTSYSVLFPNQRCCSYKCIVAWETLPCLSFNDERVTRPDFSDGRYGTGDSGYLLEVVARIIQRRRPQHIGMEKFSLFIPPSWGHKHYGKGILSSNSLRE